MVLHGFVALVALATTVAGSSPMVDGVLCPDLVEKVTEPVTLPVRGQVVAIESEHALLTLVSEDGSMVVALTSPDVLDQLELGDRITVRSPSGPTWPTSETARCRPPAHEHERRMTR